MNKNIIQTAFLICGLFLFSCSHKQKQERPNTFAPKVVETKGYLVPKDSLTEPTIVIAGKPTIVKAGNPKVVPANTNIVLAGKPKIIFEGKARIITPGQDTFLLPKSMPAIDSPFVAGIPEVVIAKDAYVKDQNPAGFSSFSKLQGLKHAVICCMLQDNRGNLWFGKYGGVSKYDGKSFTHFTEKEGLSNNTVMSILEDTRGNLWFGMDGGGVSKYDGKSFTHFTEKEGLSNNTVRSILEDKSGNLWFGTSGGVNKYDGNRVEAIEAALQRGENIPERTQQGLKKENGKFVKSFTHFTEKEGLSNNVVWSILEDKSGHLWFGTSGGVNKYDRKSFTHFTEKEGLSNNTVFSMVEDKSGNLWFGTYGGVNKYDGNRMEAIEAPLQRGESIPERTQQGLKKENRKLVKSFTHFTEKEGLSNNIVRSIMEDKSGNLWFCTIGGGVSKYDGKSFTHFTEKEGLSNNTVRSILEDKNGNVWFGTNGGVNKYDGKSFTHFTEKEGLSTNIVLAILEDKNGNLWFGTDGGGVSKYDGNRIEAIEAALQRGDTIPEHSQQGLKKENRKLVKFFTHITEKEGLSNNTVLSMLEDKSGNLWFGTNGGGVSKYDGKSFTHFTEKEGLSNNIVLSMLEDKSGNLWFGTDVGGVSKYDGNRVEAIEAALQRGETIPERTQQGLKKENGRLVKSFTHFTEKEGLSNNTVLSMLEDKSGNLWFGTYGGGVSKYDWKSFTHFTEKEGLSTNIVLSMLEDKSGNLWFGTDGGVSKYDGKSFTHFTEKEGLSSNAILSMLEDKSGNLWFGSRFGLSKLSRENKERLVFFSDNVNASKEAEGKIFFKNYTYEDGFLGIGVNGGKTICEDKNGTIWVAANDRLTAYHPEGEFTDTVAPNIQLTSIALFNENFAWVNLTSARPSPKESEQKNVAMDTSFVLGNGVSVGNFEFTGITKWYGLPENLSLAYNNNYLTFNFIGITQKQSKKVKYQYKLEGIDENWSAITNRTEAPYGNLPHGNYSFKVKAMNSEGYWSNEFNYSFTIRPPWWRTWWMYTLYGISAFMLIAGIVWWNGRRLRARAEELSEEIRIATVTILDQKGIVEEQKKVVEEKQKEVLASITYAKRIQTALLTSDEYIKNHLPAEHFILFKPKDIVSGDFYWANSIAPLPGWDMGTSKVRLAADTKRKNTFYMITADCTGHGVPGAFMSMLNISYLHENIVERGIRLPHDILNSQRKEIITALNPPGSVEECKDGMDCVLCVYDFDKMLLHFAGANNPLWLLRNGELIEYKADKMPVGKYHETMEPFTLQTIALQKGDIIYTSTDGFADQFGVNGKKLMKKKFKEELFKIHHLPMDDQREYLKQFFESWRGDNDQVDDVCVIGVRV